MSEGIDVGNDDPEGVLEGSDDPEGMVEGKLETNPMVGDVVGDVVGDIVGDVVGDMFGDIVGRSNMLTLTFRSTARGACPCWMMAVSVSFLVKPQRAKIRRSNASLNLLGLK